MRIFLLFIIIPLCTLARNDWYDPPLEIGPGSFVVDTLNPGLMHAIVHVRMHQKSGKSARWSLCWEQPAGGQSAVTVDMPDSRDNLMGYDQPTILRLCTLDGERECVIAAEPGAFSLKLVYDGFRARVLGGYSNQTLCFDDVSLCTNDTVCINVATEQPMRCRRITSDCLYSAPRLYATVADIDSCIAACATDQIAGMWEYFDRDVAETKASLGGKYTLAIVPCDNGKYEIVYLSGATTGAWERGQLKGTLEPSGFAGNYNLIWIDALGATLSDDNNAQLIPELDMLVMRFPVYKSQIRLRRRR